MSDLGYKETKESYPQTVPSMSNITKCIARSYVSEGHNPVIDLLHIAAILNLLISLAAMPW